MIVRATNKTILIYGQANPPTFREFRKGKIARGVTGMHLTLSKRLMIGEEVRIGTGV